MQQNQTTSSIAIIIPAYNEGARLLQTVTAIRNSIDDLNFEVIVVNDGSSDVCCDFLRYDGQLYRNVRLFDFPARQGVAYARNFGAMQATAPVLISMDAHCVPQAGWLLKLLDELQKPGVGIVAPQISNIDCPSATAFGLTIRSEELGVEWLHQQANNPYEVPMVGCACLAMSRELFETMGRFDVLRSYGMEDIELCIRCWLLGYSVMMVPDAIVAHWFKKEPFPVNWHDFLYNRLRTAILHFDGERLQRILTSLQTKPAFCEAITSLFVSDIWNRRAFVRQHRKHDADWFCEKFGIQL